MVFNRVMAFGGYYNRYVAYQDYVNERADLGLFYCGGILTSSEKSA